MRVCNPKNLQSDFILASPIYDRNLRLLLKDGVTLDNRLIQLIQSKKVPYVLIEDELSKGIEIRSLVSNKTQHEVTTAIRNFYDEILKKIPSSKQDLSSRAKYAITNHSIRNLPIKMLRKHMENILDEIQRIDEDYRYYSYYPYGRDFIELNFEIMLASLFVGRYFQYSEKELIYLGIAALFHDVGLIFSPLYNSYVHTYSLPLDKERDHTTYGYLFLRESNHLTAMEYIPALEHHECDDGSGFPDGKHGNPTLPNRERVEKDNEIFRFTEIISPISELIHAANAYQFSNKFNELKTSTEERFNPFVLEAMNQVINPYPVGASVRLESKTGSAYKEGLIVESDAPNFLPKIKSIDNQVIPNDKMNQYDIIVI